MITVILSKAVLCVGATCYPALIGDNTLPGEYQLVQRYVVSEGYGGDVLKYHETDERVYAIHRLWQGNPAQRREQRIQSDAVTDRQAVTEGCINVTNEVYELLVECCSNATLTIRE